MVAGLAGIVRGSGARSAFMLAWLLATTPVTVWAGELKVLDQTELTRAVRIIKQPARVVVSLSSAAADTAVIILKHIDGVQSDRIGSRTASDIFSFENVPEGIWRIAADPKLIKAVKIE